MSFPIACLLLFSFPSLAKSPIIYITAAPTIRSICYDGDENVFPRAAVCRYGIEQVVDKAASRSDKYPTTRRTPPCLSRLTTADLSF